MDTNPVSIVSPDYCLPYPTDLAIVRKVFHMKEDFVVVDGNDNLKFKVRAKTWSLHNKKVIVDADGNPVITLRESAWSMHSKWQAFRGESSEPHDLIFTAKTSSMFQFKTKLNVYLANNNDVCDYKVKGSWSEKSCVIYAGESTNVVAQMRKKTSAQSIFLGKDKFMVTVNPNIDYAFVVALIVILDAINTQAAAAASSSAAAASSSAAAASASAAAAAASASAAAAAASASA